MKKEVRKRVIFKKKYIKTNVMTCVVNVTRAFRY